jgi:hypothetical protein
MRHGRRECGMVAEERESATLGCFTPDQRIRAISGQLRGRQRSAFDHLRQVSKHRALGAAWLPNPVETPARDSTRRSPCKGGRL